MKLQSNMGGWHHPGRSPRFATAPVLLHSSETSFPVAPLQLSPARHFSAFSYNLTLAVW